MKKAIVEKSLESILEDLERLPSADRELYLENRKTLLNKVLYHDISLLDYKQFDIDSLIEVQRELVRTL